MKKFNFLLILLAMSTTAIFGQIYTLSGPINGAQANAGAGTGSAGTGTISGTYDAGTNIIDFIATFSGLSGNTSVSHIHGPASAGVNTGVTQTLNLTPSGSTSGTATYMGAYGGVGADLIAGNTYINIHSTVESGGEIRGQITATLQPAVPTLGTWSIIVLGLVMSIGGLVYITQRKQVTV